MDTDSTNTDNVYQHGTFPAVPDGHLTVPEAAERTGLSQRAIRRALSEGRLSGVQLVGRWMIPADVLDDYARSARRHRANSSPAPGESNLSPVGIEAFVQELHAVVDRAVAAEVRAEQAERKLMQIEATSSAAEIEREQLRARVAELEQQIAERPRSWWPWSRASRSQQAA